MNLKWKFHPKLQNKTGCSKGRYSATLPLPSEREKKHSILFYPSLFFLAHCSLWISSSLPCRPSLSPHSPYHSLFLSGLHQIVPPFSSIYLYIYSIYFGTRHYSRIIKYSRLSLYVFLFSTADYSQSIIKKISGADMLFVHIATYFSFPSFLFSLFNFFSLFIFSSIFVILFVFFFIFLKLFNNMYIWEDVCMYVLFNMSELK